MPDAESSSEPPSSVPQLRSEPNTSAKRRRLNSEPGSAHSQVSSPSVGTRSSTRSTRHSSGQKPNHNNAHVLKNIRSPELDSTPAARMISARLGTLNLNKDGTPMDLVDDDTPRGFAELAAEEQNGEGDLEILPDAMPERNSPGSATHVLSTDAMMALVEEVMESPTAAPGSGQRRRIGQASATTQSAKLQRAVMLEEEAGATGEVVTSSPLARKTRQSTATSLGTESPRTTRTSTRRVSSSPIEALHGSSPLARHSRKSDSQAPGSARSTRSQHRPSTLSTVAFEADQFTSPPDAAGSSSVRKPHPKPKTSETVPEPPTEIADPQVEEQDAEADDEEGEEVEVPEETGRVRRQRTRVSPRQKQPAPLPDDGKAEDAVAAEEVNDEATPQITRKSNRVVTQRNMSSEVPDSEELGDHGAVRRINRKSARVSPRRRQPPEDEEAEADEAEEVNDYETARQLGRKRPRVSPRRKEPPDDAGSRPVEIERPAKESQSKRKRDSPAKQAQPKAVKEKKKKSSTRRKSDGSSIPVTVQRYTKPLRRNVEDGTDEDILNADLPFTDHKSPNVIDVVLQMCEESVEKYLSALHDEASQADGSANRKIFRTKLRTVEAFQEELRTRLQAQVRVIESGIVMVRTNKARLLPSITSVP